MTQEDGGRRENPHSEDDASRRRFSAREKLRILEEADACADQGQIDALMRREGISSSSLSRWRRERDRGQLDGPRPGKRGPQRTVDPELAEENAALRREHERLRRRLQQAEMIVEAQRELARALGLELPAQEDRERD